MKPKHLFHKMGGRIVEIHGVGHRTLEKVPYWFFLCDVKWDDTGKTREGIEVLPDRLCADQSIPEATAELDEAMKALNEHLRTHGKWLDKGKWISDHLVHWLPKKEPAHVTTI